MNSSLGLFISIDQPKNLKVETLKVLSDIKLRVRYSTWCNCALSLTLSIPSVSQRHYQQTIIVQLYYRSCGCWHIIIMWKVLHADGHFSYILFFSWSSRIKGHAGSSVIWNNETWKDDLLFLDISGYIDFYHCFSLIWQECYKFIK